MFKLATVCLKEFIQSVKLWLGGCYRLDTNSPVDSADGVLLGFVIDLLNFPVQLVFLVADFIYLISNVKKI